MSLHKNLEKHIKTLNLNELEELFNILSSLLISPIYSSDFNEEIKEAKYFKGEICPRCYKNHIIKYGKRYDRQRFKCKKCGKVFDERTSSIISSTKLPIDKWFKYEVYWHRSSGSDGRFWSAVNGQVIVDRWGPNMGKYNLPITRIMVNNAYTGGYATVQSHSTGLEIWDGFPCGVGRSCYNYDKVAPTIPAALKSTITKYSSSANVSLTWTASSDNVSVAGYNIYRNGGIISTALSTNFINTIPGAATGSLYTYDVRAIDAEGNLSDRSNYASVVF